MIVSAVSTTTSWMTSHFTTNNYRDMYGFQMASQFNSIWGQYGGVIGTNPYKVVVDRDGMLRFAGSSLSGAEIVWKQCLGVS